MSTVQVGTWTGTESWNGDVWEDPDGAGDIEPLILMSSLLAAAVSLSPVKVASSPLSQGINPVLPKESVTAPAKQLTSKTMLVPLRGHPAPLFASRPITGFKLQQP